MNITGTFGLASIYQSGGTYVGSISVGQDIGAFSSVIHESGNGRFVLGAYDNSLQKKYERYNLDASRSWTGVIKEYNIIQ